MPYRRAEKLCFSVRLLFISWRLRLRTAAQPLFLFIASRKGIAIPHIEGRSPIAKGKITTSFTAW